MITSYRIVQCQADELGGNVNAYVKEGWRPFGTPTFLDVLTADKLEFCTYGYQAMVKENEERPGVRIGEL